MNIKHNYQNKIIDLIKQELVSHPQAELVDIYKLFYQDYFGCGHFFSDQESIITYLTHEINDASLTKDTAPEIQEICCFNNFIRVDINWVTCGYLTISKLADLFWQSSRIQLDQPIPWFTHWQNICQIIARENFLNCQPDKEKLEAFANNKNGVHHSEIYRQKYQPHYRIIHRDFWKL
jgi:hypothetical protein